MYNRHTEYPEYPTLTMTEISWLANTAHSNRLDAEESEERSKNFALDSLIARFNNKGVNILNYLINISLPHTDSFLFANLSGCTEMFLKRQPELIVQFLPGYQYLIVNWVNINIPSNLKFSTMLVLLNFGAKIVPSFLPSQNVNNNLHNNFISVLANNQFDSQYSKNERIILSMIAILPQIINMTLCYSNNLNEFNQLLLTVFSTAVCGNDVHVSVKCMLTKILKGENNDNILHFIAKFYDSLNKSYPIDKVLCVLQRSGLDFNAQNSYGKTPLHYALDDFAFEEIVDLLLQYNADVNIQDYYGDTPLDIAYESGTINKISHILAKYGIDLKTYDCKEGAQTPQITEQCVITVDSLTTQLASQNLHGCSRS